MAATASFSNKGIKQIETPHATSPFESSAGKPIWATYDPQALTPMAPATAEATAMMILRITSQVDFFMMLTF